MVLGRMLFGLILIVFEKNLCWGELFLLGWGGDGCGLIGDVGIVVVV